MVRDNIDQKLDMCKERFPCPESIVVTDLETGEVFCQKCGIVQNVSQGKKNSLLLSSEDFALRNGSKTSLRLYDMGLSTNVGSLNHDSAGKPVDYKMKIALRRMRVWDSRSKTKNTSGRNLRAALTEIEKLKEKLTLTDMVAERSAYIYRKAAKSQLIRGRNVKDMAAACVYVACRELDVSRTILDISNKLQVKRSAIAKNYRLLFQNLQLNISVPDPVKCIIKIANNLKTSESTKREAIRIFDRLKELELIAGKKPDAVAATIIYMASIKTGENLTQQKIAETSGITGVTIRNRFQEYKKHISLI